VYNGSSSDPAAWLGQVEEAKGHTYMVRDCYLLMLYFSLLRADFRPSHVRLRHVMTTKCMSACCHPICLNCERDNWYTQISYPFHDCPAEEVKVCCDISQPAHSCAPYMTADQAASMLLTCGAFLQASRQPAYLSSYNDNESALLTSSRLLADGQASSRTLV
jgi:hypothetical protein